MNEDDKIDDLFDRSEWPVGARTGRQSSEPNQQALPGTPAAAIEMAECRGWYRHRSPQFDNLPKMLQDIACPICDQKQGHKEGCGYRELNRLIEDVFLYGSHLPRGVTPSTVESLKESAKECRVVIVVGGGPSLPAGLLATLGNLPGVRMVTEQLMLKEREIVGERLHMDLESHDFGFLEEAVVTGHGRALAMKELGLQLRNNATLPSNRSETGRHGPKDSFHRKRKKGRS